jgi:alpha/beta superfamily hydrolase
MSVAFAETLSVPGPRGPLAGRLDGPDGPPAGAALILNPHPLMGGRMDHPLLAAVVEALVGRDIACLRFDYAGTGESGGTAVDVGASMADFWRTGTAPEDPALIEDARAADAMLADIVSGPRILVGYSFGAVAAIELAADRPTRGLGLICPTTARHQLADVPPGVPVEIVHGAGDFAADDRVLDAWVARQRERGPVGCTEIPGGHFLRGHELVVAERIATGVTA